MNDRHYDRIAWIGKFRKLLNLTDWEIAVAPDVETTEFHAEIDYRDVEKVAQITFWTRTPQAQEELTVAHEMVHLAMHRYENLVGHLLALLDNDKLRDAYADLLEDEEEVFVETIARALVPSTVPRFVPVGDNAVHWPAWAPAHHTYDPAQDPLA